MVRLNTKRLKSFLLVSLSALLIMLSIPLSRRPLLGVLKYPLKTFNRIGEEYKAFFSYHYNYVENKKLSRQLGILNQKLMHVDELYLENKRLRGLLALKEQSDYNLVAAQVISRDPSYWTSVVIIDKGRSSGIKENLAVITYGGLVGKVIEAGLSTSKVMLLNDLNFGVSAIIQRTRQEGLVSGTLENKLIMRHLSPDSEIVPGDLVMTSGLTYIFPKGIAIGKVIEIGKEFSGLSVFCTVKPVVDLSKLEEVLVIIK